MLFVLDKMSECTPLDFGGDGELFAIQNGGSTAPADNAITVAGEEEVPSAANGLESNLNATSSGASFLINQLLMRKRIYDGLFLEPEDYPTTMTSTAAAAADPDAYSSLVEHIEDVVNERVIVAICAVGLVANFWNLAVLGRMSATRPMERMEKSAHLGLIALALSDALFCVAVLPTAGVGSRVFGFRRFDFRIIYAAYGNAVINTFILSSTWLIVAMAGSRYVSVCHPLVARVVVGRRFSIVSMGGVFAASVAVNVPRYFRREIASIACLEGGRFYYLDDGPLARAVGGETAFQWAYFVVGIVLPFVLLVFFNVNLVRALRRSLRMREIYAAGARNGRTGNHRDSGAGGEGERNRNRVTLTLVVIIAAYIVLLVPSEVMNFLKETAVRDVDLVGAYNLALSALNLLQALNFAFNFLLYCAVNVAFRRTLLGLVCCIRGQQHAELATATMLSRTEVAQRAASGGGGVERRMQTGCRVMVSGTRGGCAGTVPRRGAGRIKESSTTMQVNQRPEIIEGRRSTTTNPTTMYV